MFTEAKDDGSVVTTGAIGRAKLQSNHHHQQTNTQFFYRPDALPVAQPTDQLMELTWQRNTDEAAVLANALKT